MSEGANANPAFAPRGQSPRWRTAALGSAIVIFAGIVGHAIGLPLAPARSAEAHVNAVPALAYVGGAPADPHVDDVADPDAQRFSGRIGPDLTAALRGAGVPEAQGREYVAVLARAIPLAGELSVDDRFDLVIERRKDGSLGQLVYAGLDRIARADVELMKWTDGKEIIWVNGDGVGGTGDQSIGRPVNGRLTSGFGSRFHPVLGHRRMHKGVDLAAPNGSPIAAAADGRVIAAGWNGGYGRQVAIAHSGNVRTTYGHMSRIAAAPGTYVRRGQIIGFVGSSGLSTGPHLHFEVTRDGRPVNPLSAKLTGGLGHLQGEQLRAFQDQLRRVLLAPAQG